MSLANEKCESCHGTAALTQEVVSRYLGELPQWALDKSGKAIERRYTFKNFAEALAFVNKAGEIAEANNHHPDIALGWGYANVTFTTHDAGGVTKNDVVMAAKVDAL